MNPLAIHLEMLGSRVRKLEEQLRTHAEVIVIF